MAYAFRQQSEIERQVRAIALEQINKALDESRGRGDLDEAIHGLRKRCKRLRGLVRLIKPAFKGYKDENRAFREAANGLSGARDAAVMLETFEALVEFDTNSGEERKIATALEDAVRLLLSERSKDAQEGRDQGEMLEQFQGLMEAAEKRAKDWSLRGRGFDLIGEGLEETYRSFRKQMQLAAEEQTSDAFHEWRKDAKYHWHHVNLFEKCAPDVLGARKEQLNQLGGYLGDHHDLAVLEDSLVSDPGPIAAEEIKTLRKIVEDRQDVLAQRALALGAQLAIDKPAALAERFEQFWLLLDKD